MNVRKNILQDHKELPFRKFDIMILNFYQEDLITKNKKKHEKILAGANL